MLQAIHRHVPVVDQVMDEGLAAGSKGSVLSNWKQVQEELLGGVDWEGKREGGGGGVEQ